MPVNIVYYVSGHGFGHATRVSQICRALIDARPSTRITICTKAPRHLFPLCSSDGITYREREVDSTVVQPLPYEIDVLATFRDLRRFLGEGRDMAWAREEGAFIDASAFDLVLADAPWVVGLLRGTSEKCPSIVLVSNFSFDLIFARLLDHLPSTTSPADREDYRAMTGSICRAYQKFNHLIRLPGHIDFPFLARDSTCEVSDSPLIYRPARRTKSETLAALGLPHGSLGSSNVLLVQFGGHLVADADAAAATHHVPHLPPDWLCLTNASIDDPRFIKFPDDIYLPDLVGASDLVLGKIGYGTVSECVGMGKPLLFVARDMFAEEAYLLRYMRQQGSCHELDRTRFETGQWSDDITKAWQSVQGTTGRGCEDGSLELAERIYTLID
ncbi:protein of unknown function [Taphrina deformans PYCC 5710]|uniref:L-arabinokinase n=1 Tax=Taphrina deformans (strain PYCC 5710 / ATCC 11124 / CBS 356.35 / IMI 108563 / JCM 9778 / NBRC 8474) TaxID=1097556 RepID=S0BE45_TAPDE|nr:protein of unknown function [Taphrina deformans PYCC 5710]|eukprot:CCG81550.1 protein of unknown function [Taphrina deformans PYCC 5710]